MASLVATTSCDYKVSGKLKQPHGVRMTNGSQPSGMKVWVTSPRNVPRHAEVLAEGTRNAKWVVEDSGYNDQLRPCDQGQN